MADTYNGWTNYETWAVQTYIDNTEYTQRYWREQATAIYRQSNAANGLTKQENAVCDLADALSDEHSTAASDLLEGSQYESGILADLLRASLSDVNWREIAKGMIEAAAEGDDE